MRIFAFNPVNTNSSYLYNNKYGTKYAVNFKGQDLLELPEKDVFERIKESMIPENFLGQGTEAEVYRIKDTDYCVRMPYGLGDIYMQNYTRELTPADRLNHVVAKLGFGSSIMKYLEGVIPKWYINNNYNRYGLQERIANMPVESYTGLLHQIADAVNNEMLFDFSGGNLIVDTEKQKLTAIDFYKMSENPRQVKPLSEMYSVLTCYGSEKETGKKIFDNIVSAAFEEFKPNKIPCMDVALFDFIELCLKRMGEAHTPSGEKIKESVVFNADSLKMLKKKEIQNKMLSPVLEQQILVLKKLIGKVK